MRLCGINSRFQLLSPCMRQVTHALLTRPPLSHRTIIPEGNQVKCFVRLACVKHAASVHPEPGSNSHVKVCSGHSKAWLLFNRFLLCLKCSQSLEKLSFFFRISGSFKVISLFSYQGPLSFPVARDSFYILSKLFAFVKNFFNS